MSTTSSRPNSAGIAADLDLDTALAMIIGPFTYRRSVERRDVTSAFAVPA